MPHIRMARAGSKLCTTAATEMAGGETAAYFNHRNCDADLRMRDFLGDDSRPAEMNARDTFADTINVCSVTIN